MFVVNFGFKMITRRFAKDILSQERIIWYDLETTGFNPYSDQIIEIGACDNYGNTFNMLLLSDRILRPKITEITGITDDELKQHGVEQEKGLMDFYKFITKYSHHNNTLPCLIAHNNDGFDKLFINYQFNKYAIPKLEVRYIDTLRMSQLTLSHLHFHSMNSLCNYFNIVNTCAHRALDDSIALKNIYYPLLHLFKSKFYDDIDKFSSILEFIIYKLENPVT